MESIQRINRVHWGALSPEEHGCEAGEPVSPDYGPRDNAFSGKINWVRIDIDEAAKDADHLIGVEERFKLAMARQ